MGPGGGVDVLENIKPLDPAGIETPDRSPVTTMTELPSIRNSMPLLVTRIDSATKRNEYKE